MSGENPTPEFILSDEDKKRMERLDFDNVFSHVQTSLKPYLQKTIATSFGIQNLIIGADSVGSPLDDERDYTDTLRSVETVESNVDGSVLIMANPGSIAIDRFWGALDEYLIGDFNNTEKYITKTRAHEMYSCTLVVNAYMLAAMTEIGDGNYPDFYENFVHIDSTLRNSVASRRAIEKSDFRKKDELLRLMDFIVDDEEKAMVLSQHRLAAGLYFEVYRKAEAPIRKALVESSRIAVENVLFKLDLDDETAWEKLQIIIPNPSDVATAAEDTDGSPLLAKLKRANKVKAERLSLDLLGWAFPMSRAEVVKFLYGFTGSESQE